MPKSSPTPPSGQPSQTPADAAQPPATGRIDIHCHLIPGIDDGCENHEQTFACIRRLKKVGYTGSICTPHVWLDLYPRNDMPRIRQWVRQLQQDLHEAGIDYQLWAGGEVRLFPGLPDWLERNEMPTLAGTRCVLVDFWDKRWHSWIDETFDWLLERDYLPILAHPERSAIPDLPDHLARARQRGVRLQGNTRCLTGEEGEQAERWARQFLLEDWYDLLAFDIHRPDSLESRITGLDVARKLVGPEVVDRKTIHAPRELIFNS